VLDQSEAPGGGQGFRQSSVASIDAPTFSACGSTPKHLMNPIMTATMNNITKKGFILRHQSGFDPTILVVVGAPVARPASMRIDACETIRKQSDSMPGAVLRESVGPRVIHPADKL
jgi:hypothetical protein